MFLVFNIFFWGCGDESSDLVKSQMVSMVQMVLMVLMAAMAPMVQMELQRYLIHKKNHLVQIVKQEEPLLHMAWTSMPMGF